MARFKLVNGREVALTAREESARDAEEAEWEAGAAVREAARKDAAYNNDTEMPSPREKIDALIDAANGSNDKLIEINARIEAVKAKHGVV